MTYACCSGAAILTLTHFCLLSRGHDTARSRHALFVQPIRQAWSSHEKGEIRDKEMKLRSREHGLALQLMRYRFVAVILFKHD